MEEKSNPITTSSSEVTAKAAGGVVCVGLAIAGFVTGYWGWGIVAIFGAIAFFGAAFGLSGRADCPACGRALSQLRVLGFLRCQGCQNYLEIKQQRLYVAGDQALADEPHFAVPLPWEDVATRTTFAPVMGLPTLNSESRTLPAAWPPGCCVCGQASTRKDSFQQSVIKTGGLLDKRISISVVEIPYCAAHKDGVRLGYDPDFPGDPAILLLFRSHAYYKAFRALNGWGAKPPAAPENKA
ncbi:MAG: hypothetical protein HY291_03060 [Planctomycetes bacterium]|nr:hypothetical protein [Planctomycetota bacterium]